MLHINKNGSVSLETAIVIPVIITVFMFCYGILYTFLLYNCISRAMYRTADFASTYSIIYHKNGIETMTNNLKEKICNELKIDISELLKYSDDVIYISFFESYFQKELENDSVFMNIFKENTEWHISESSFFNGNDDINIKGYFKLNFTVPLFSPFIKGFAFEKNVCVKAMSDGITPDFSQEELQSVWSLSNFERGKKLQQKFGRNLPEFFPVLDFFKDGQAKVITSINHTLDTYQNQQNLNMKLNDILESIINYPDSSYGNITITTKMITKREILLIFPKNQFEDEQKEVIEDFKKMAKSLNVSVKIERYEYT